MAGDEEAVGGQKGREDYVEQQVQVEIRPTHTHIHNISLVFFKTFLTSPMNNNSLQCNMSNPKRMVSNNILFENEKRLYKQE